MDNKKIRELLESIDNFLQTDFPKTNTQWAITTGNLRTLIAPVLALLDEPEKIIPCTCCLCDKWECHTHDFCPKIGIYGKPESQPCKTCGGSKKVQWDYNDPEVEAIVKAEGDCPDCQKQDEFVKRTRELFEGFRDISETGKLLLEACDRLADLKAKLEAERKEKRLWKKRVDEAAECVSDYEEIKQKLEAAEKYNKIPSNSLLANTKVLFDNVPFTPFSVARELFIRAEQAGAKLEAEKTRADAAEKENEKLTESKSFFKKAVIERMKTIRQQAERIAYLEAYLGQSKP